MLAKPPSGAAYGWRARLALLAAHPGPENIPYEFYLMAPDGVTLIVTSIDIVIPPSARGNPEDLRAEYEAAMQRAEKGVAELAERHPDAMMQLGMPAIMAQGWGFEEQLRGRMEKLSGAPFVTSVRATIEALQTLGMSRVVILNPFEGYGKGIPDYVRNAGIDVVGMAALRETYHHDFETEPTAVAYRAARTLVKEHKGIDGLWITGASTPCASIIEDLEHDLGIPVVTNWQALIWASLKTVGMDPSEVVGYGKLFSQ